MAVLLLVGAGDAGAGSGVPVTANDVRATATVTSFLEQRERNLVRQGWDISCGAAALSTILTHHFGTPYTEATIAVSILANTDPALVRERGGFSLLDLKRFAEAVGYTADGYANVTLDDLADRGGPAILPVHFGGLDHFVVFRGRVGGRVLIGDPAFGNLTFSEQRFLKAWPSGIAFFVDRPGEDPGERLSAEAMQLAIPDLNYVYRLGTRHGVMPATRR